MKCQHQDSLCEIPMQIFITSEKLYDWMALAGCIFQTRPALDQHL